MRARYTAYTQIEMDFIEKTHDPKTNKDIDMRGSQEWAESTNWQGLEIVKTIPVSYTHLTLPTKA